MYINKQIIKLTSKYRGFGSAGMVTSTQDVSGRKLLYIITQGQIELIAFYLWTVKTQIVENFDIQENEDFEIDEEENTMSILNRYIDEAEFEFDKNIIKGIFQDLYRQACEVE